jgi:predicted amidophosphoribosyltransferase
MNINGIIDVFLGNDVINDEEELESTANKLREELKYAQEQHILTTPVNPINTYISSYGATCGICPRCTKGVNSETDKFCHNCGAKLNWQ